VRLAPGIRLGPYEVLSVLGTGGMAEVYRARDTRLGRDIALKVVNEALAGDAELVRRFEFCSTRRSIGPRRWPMAWPPHTDVASSIAT
jgi:serine/threonine protein kinase